MAFFAGLGTKITGQLFAYALGVSFPVAALKVWNNPLE